jgi:hypothetical protein
VVRRADGAEAVAGQLEGDTGKLGPQPVDAAVALELEPATLLDPLEVVRGCAPPLDAELRPVPDRPDHFRAGQLAGAPGGIGIALTDGPHEGVDGPVVGNLGVDGDQRHPAVDRRTGQVRTDRAGRRDGDAGRQLHPGLVVEIGQYHRWSGQVRAPDSMT